MIWTMSEQILQEKKKVNFKNQSVSVKLIPQTRKLTLHLIKSQT